MFAASSANLYTSDLYWVRRSKLLWSILLIKPWRAMKVNALSILQRMNAASRCLQPKILYLLLRSVGFQYIVSSHLWVQNCGTFSIRKLPEVVAPLVTKTNPETLCFSYLILPCLPGKDAPTGAFLVDIDPRAVVYDSVSNGWWRMPFLLSVPDIHVGLDLELRTFMILLSRWSFLPSCHLNHSKQWAKKATGGETNVT